MDRHARLVLPGLLALGAAVALLGRDSARERSLPSARVPGAALGADRDAPPSKEETPAAPAPSTTRKPPPELAPLRGDAALAGEIALDSAVLEDGRYQVRLKSGARAVLTLEPAIQAAAERVLARAKAPKAAVVVMAVDGRILAIAGRRDQGETPALDLALSVWAPAASVFKIVTAAALLQAGVASDLRTCVHGGLRSVDPVHLSESPRDNDCMTIGAALSRSQNAVFGRLAHRHLDRRKLSRAARAFGMDRASRFALDAEKNRFDLPEDPLEFARVAAGFWSSEISPLGGAVLTNTVASGGFRVTPRIVHAIEHADGRIQPVVSADPERVLPAAVASEVARMMIGTTAARGTAYQGFHDPRGRAFFPEVAVAGKTGSLTRRRPSYLAYSWFVGFAPADDPQVVISVLLGNPERWHLKAHTAARLVLGSVY